MKLVELDDIIYGMNPSSNSEKTSTLVKTTDGKYYAVYLDIDNVIRLREAKMFPPKTIKKVEVVKPKSWIENLYGTLRHGRGGFSG